LHFLANNDQKWEGNKRHFLREVQQNVGERGRTFFGTQIAVMEDSKGYR
jgi:hypothetical protein